MKSSIRIPLPDIKRSQEATIHPYPFQIALQTIEFMQGSLFHASLVDIASGAYVRQRTECQISSASLWNDWILRKLMTRHGGLLGNIKLFLERVPFQSVLIALNSHWDWYARKLINFIQFARRDLNQPALAKSEIDRIKRFCLSSNLRAIGCNSNCCLQTPHLGDADKSELQEMALVRNLGLP